MILANELRVGNLIKSGRIIVPVDARTIFDIWDSSNNYDPISLTPEWLERFGFSKENRMYYKDAYFISMPISKGECGFGLKNTIGIIATFHYVHQLQNLYFALTKEELAVTSKSPAAL